MNQNPLVSIVVPTRNSASTLEVCLESIRKQRYPRIEVLVVDNYSADETSMIVEEFGMKSLFRGPERSSQRNYGQSIVLEIVCFLWIRIWSLRLMLWMSVFRR